MQYEKVASQSFFFFPKTFASHFRVGLSLVLDCCSLSFTSFLCRLSSPSGLLYVVLKHVVDRYNIYYAYVPTKLNQRIHRAAISQVVVAPILCMFWLLFFSTLRLGGRFASESVSSAAGGGRRAAGVTSSLFSAFPPTGPAHPITLFTSASLLACIAFSLIRLCLRKPRHRSTSYQVSHAPRRRGHGSACRASVV